MVTIDEIAEVMPNSYARLIRLREKSDAENGESGRGIYWTSSITHNLLKIENDSLGLAYLRMVETAPCKDLMELLEYGLPKGFKLPEIKRLPAQYRQPETGWGTDFMPA